MYLSQLILNPRSRQVRSELARPYELHRTVMSGFAPAAPGERVLYRLDLSERDGIPRLLVQSRHAPDWTHLQQKGDYLLELPGDNPAVRTFEIHAQTGQRFAFRLLANPTRSVKNVEAPGKRGKRVSIGRPEDQVAWLERKAAAGGFRICDLRITNLGPRRVSVPDKKELAVHSARHRAVRFDGVLEVTDPDAFRRAVENGVGSAKGFGYGLLSIAPL